jgi:hypothetical protein
MNRAFKAVIYVVLLAVITVLAVRFYQQYKVVMRTPPRMAVVEGADSSPSPAASAPSSTKATESTNLAAATNTTATADVEPEPDTATPTNTVAPSNQPPTKAAAHHPRHSRHAVSAGGEEAEGPTFSTLMTYGVALFAAAVCFSVLLAHDFSHVVADRFQQFILSDEGEGIKAPEYDRAEQVWADGHPLEAIQLMRDYLRNNPRALYAALRIAEIYEKDLGNYLAAALEYEEVLKHRLRPEQWGWAAIHLANLYSGKLNQADKAIVLLRRIVSDYGETTAAGKARFRLSQLEGESGEAAAAPSPEIEEEPVPPSNLPKGFRPKKQ